ncbi:MAG: hypothetical protein KBC91_04115 [Candidatus Omnitrophica bacterium]|nr:hypothetical protein [Candidatus Omnitrophota bacterium]
MTKDKIEEKDKREFGEQPLAAIMTELALKPHALVEASKEQLTHKTVARAMKGRRLTSNSKMKVLRALNKVSGKSYLSKHLFNYK